VGVDTGWNVDFNNVARHTQWPLGRGDLSRPGGVSRHGKVSGPHPRDASPNEVLPAQLTPHFRDTVKQLYNYLNDAYLTVLAPGASTHDEE
jgi:hypothetical protein